jgi:hypothetical protein
LEIKVRLSPGVSMTDGVIDRMLIPASELMRAEQNHRHECLRRGVRAGAPLYRQHDMHRPLGWSRTLGLYVDSEMVRVLGLTEEAETEQEKAELQKHLKVHWSNCHREGAEPYRDDLMARVRAVDVSGVSFLWMEAAVAKRTGIAADLYPDLFTPGLASVDKDGLADYRAILERMEQVQLGVFHDKDRDLLVFAHRFFRRSFSHWNKLNSYFLQSFDATVRENGGLRARLKLDPDLVGHPSSLRNLIELEYWRGPLYSDDIAAIPDGVAEHKADERTKLYEGIDRTQVWWKAPESRRINGQVNDHRTFEIEELTENPSGGLGDDEFGCRYAHAEFSANEGAITHFDGAIRAYAWRPYLERIETSIDRAGKHADYTKVFRFDGALPIPHWKRLLSDFFRGNKLIPEYLGAAAEKNTRTASPANTSVAAGETALAALISLTPGSIDGPIQLYAEFAQNIGGQIVPCVEVGVGEVEKHLRTRLNLGNITMIGFRHDILNLSRLCFGPSDNLKTTFDTEVTALATALEQDARDGLIRRAAIPLAWEDNGLVVTLTIAGDVSKVVAALHKLPATINPTQPPSEWIEPLSDLIKATVPRRRSPVIWAGVLRGVLDIPRTGVVEQQMRMPDALRQELASSGKLNTGKAEALPEQVDTTTHSAVPGA